MLLRPKWQKTSSGTCSTRSMMPNRYREVANNPRNMFLVTSFSQLQCSMSGQIIGWVTTEHVARVSSFTRYLLANGIIERAEQVFCHLGLSTITGFSFVKSSSRTMRLFRHYRSSYPSLVPHMSEGGGCFV